MEDNGYEKNIVSGLIVEDLEIMYEIKLSNDNSRYFILKDSEKIGIYKKLREHEKKKIIFYR